MKRNLMLFVMVLVVFVSANIMSPFVPEATPSFFGDEKRASNWDGVKSVKFTLLGGMGNPESESENLSQAAQFFVEAGLGGIMNEDFESVLTFNYLDVAGDHPIYVGAFKEKWYFKDLYTSATLYPYTFAVVGVAYYKETTTSALQGVPLAEGVSVDKFDNHLAMSGGLGLEWLATKNVWVVVEGGYYDFGEDMVYVMLKAGVSIGFGW